MCRNGSVRVLWLSVDCNLFVAKKFCCCLIVVVVVVVAASAIAVVVPVQRVRQPIGNLPTFGCHCSSLDLHHSY